MSLVCGTVELIVPSREHRMALPPGRGCSVDVDVWRGAAVVWGRGGGALAHAALHGGGVAGTGLLLLLLLLPVGALGGRVAAAGLAVHRGVEEGI